MSANLNIFDVIIIGGGPGGYVGAIRAAQLGMKVAVVEKRSAMGGTCLNVGCIPSKALLSASEKYHAAAHEFEHFGIMGLKPKLDLAKMMAHKDQVITDNTKGIDFLLKKNGVTRISGHGQITDAHTVTITDGKDKGQTLGSRKAIIIATGSEPTPLAGVPIDEKTIVTSTGALSINKVPETMVVIGGGYIGLEMASIWQRLGAQVTVIEYLDRLVPTMDGEVAKEFQKILGKQGIQFKLGHKVTKAEIGKKGGAVLSVEPAAGGKSETVNTDIVLVAVGRRPYTANLGLEALGVAKDPRGFIIVDDTFETSVEGIYAIGDTIHGPMLAHKAEEDGVALAEMLAGQAGHVDYDLVPGVVYTVPEVASIGKTEEQLKAANITYRLGKFPFSANGRARSMGMTDGFVKILSDQKTDKILGAHIIGPEAGALIHEVATVMAFGGSAEDLARTCHAHPTLNEAVKEAAMAAGMGKAIHA